ncbi:hypothetical protein [uncultured Corynebacterium sp.]|uniref:hypothetical protein n=1 Tax=uncultured Corynebacterium sp. TaxID=159447 RepID=UPI0025E65D8A|nr:hypothetical protein [uncultured Corynebacterium sp.]
MSAELDTPREETTSGFRAWWRTADRAALVTVIAAVISVLTFVWFPVGSVIALVTLIAAVMLLRRPTGWRGTVWTAFGISVAVLVATALVVFGLISWTTATDDGGGPATATPVSVPASPARN